MGKSYWYDQLYCGDIFYTETAHSKMPPLSQYKNGLSLLHFDENPTLGKPIFTYRDVNIGIYKIVLAVQCDFLYLYQNTPGIINITKVIAFVSLLTFIDHGNAFDKVNQSKCSNKSGAQTFVAEAAVLNVCCICILKFIYIRPI